jgi:hypothetical protein
MTSPDDTPTLDDVMQTTESAPRDRQEHGKASPRQNDDALQHRADQERQMVGSDDAPLDAEEHSATE